MKVVKYILIVNAATLVMNGMIVWLTIVRAFPPILGIVLFLGCLGGLVWVSCKINGKLPTRRPHRALYAAPTEKMGRFR